MQFDDVSARFGTVLFVSDISGTRCGGLLLTGHWCAGGGCVRG